MKNVIDPKIYPEINMRKHPFTSEIRNFSTERDLLSSDDFFFNLNCSCSSFICLEKSPASNSRRVTVFNCFFQQKCLKIGKAYKMLKKESS